MGSEQPIVALNIAQADMRRMPEHLAIADANLDWIHFDVADGQFVQRLTFGASILELSRRFSRAAFDVHLMVANPERLVVPLCISGANTISIHPATTEAPRELLHAIRAERARSGIVVCPQTSFESVRPLLPDVDMVTIMTSGLDYESYEFMPEMLERVHSAREAREREGLSYLIQVDGGLSLATVSSAREAGADVFVMGPAIYATADPAYTLAVLRSSLRGEPMPAPRAPAARLEPQAPRIFKTRRAA
jgi:ribulose-phosphate 3-epimerase